MPKQVSCSLLPRHLHQHLSYLLSEVAFVFLSPSRHTLFRCLLLSRPPRETASQDDPRLGLGSMSVLELWKSTLGARREGRRAGPLFLVAKDPRIRANRSQKLAQRVCCVTLRYLPPILAPHSIHRPRIALHHSSHATILFRQSWHNIHSYSLTYLAQ